jgi:hypothetical protein
MKTKNKEKTMNKQLVALLASYGRSLLAAGIALYAAGVTDPAQLANALWAALLPVIIRYVNPSDPAFGRLPSADSVAAAAKTAKATTKKPATVTKVTKKK